MTGPRIGSLFSGVGGLDEGVRQVFGGEVQWFVEFEAAPSKVLATHWPDVPNYGDVTAVDWAVVPRVDILTGGFPCQDVSLAGLRRGLKDGTRSGLWSEFARAIDLLRPQLVVIENVRGLLSAEADRQMESSPWGVGDRHDGPALRALGAVLGDLADLGYDAEWCGVRAADAGAPHGRYRIFVVAYPHGRRDGWGAVAPGRREGTGADFALDGSSAGTHGRPASAIGATAADAKSIGREPRVVPSGGSEKQSFPGGHRRDTGSADDPGVTDNRSRTPARDARGRFIAAAPDPAGARRSAGEDPGADRGNAGPDGRWGVEPERGGGERAREATWGTYAPAIARWESVLGRPAPAPVEPTGKGGANRLSPRFVEWMMGLDEGHVTGSGIKRNDQLKALGNGVVPQQAALALRSLGW